VTAWVTVEAEAPRPFTERTFTDIAVTDRKTDPIMCGSPTQTVELPAGTDITNASIIQGTVFGDTGPVAGAFVRLLDETGEFTAEVVTSGEGYYRFFAAPGRWTVRALSRAGNGTETLSSQIGVHRLDIQV